MERKTGVGVFENIKNRKDTRIKGDTGSIRYCRHVYFFFFFSAGLRFPPHRRICGSLYPRHTGGAVLLRVLVKTAITVVIPPVDVNSFPPIPITPVYRSRTATGSPYGRQSTFARFHGGFTPVTPEARCHYGFWSKPPSP